jgi:S-adenosylmethionine:tRNA ribosyltransferase-isomerase
LESWAEGGVRKGESELFISPGYRWRAVDVLLTNFHLPRSTLLAMVMAFAGKELIREAYEVAVRERYRFFSFGDAMLLIGRAR